MGSSVLEALMPNRYLQALKHIDNFDRRVEKEAARAFSQGQYGLNSIPNAIEYGYKVWRSKGIMRRPAARFYVRSCMIERLTKAVKDLEIKALMDKMEIGKTKTRKPRAKKVVE